MQQATVTGAILDVYDRLSESERRVADFMLKSTDQVSTLMASELATASGTSNATVSRFVRELGYDSYAQLRVALAREETAHEGEEDMPTGISFDDVPGSVLYVAQHKKEEIDDTVAALDMGELEQVARLIQRSELVLVVGVGTSLELAQMVAVKLTHVGVRAVSPATSDAAMTLAMLLTGADCILFVSNSGRSRRLAAIMDNAEDAAIPTIAITSDSTSPISTRATHALTVRVRDQLLAEGVVLSHNSLNFVLEVITQLLLHDSEAGGTYIRQFGRTAKIAEEK